MDFLDLYLILVFHVNTFASHELNSYPTTKLGHSTQRGTIKGPKLWFYFCELYLHQSINSELITGHYSFLYQKVTINIYKSFYNTFQLLCLNLNAKYTLLHKNQYEIHDYFSGNNFNGENPCRNVHKRNIICNMPFGQFSTSELLIKHYNHLEHNLLLKSNEHFHYHICIFQFHLFKSVDNKEKDALKIGPVVDSQMSPSYLFEGHIAPWEIVFTRNIMRFMF